MTVWQVYLQKCGFVSTINFLLGRPIVPLTKVDALLPFLRVANDELADLVHDAEIHQSTRDLVEYCV